MKSNKPVTVKICFYLELKDDKNHAKLTKNCGRWLKQVLGVILCGICDVYFKLANLFMVKEAMLSVPSHCIGQMCALSHKQQQALQTVSGRT